MNVSRDEVFPLNQIVRCDYARFKAAVEQYGYRVEPHYGPRESGPRADDCYISVSAETKGGDEVGLFWWDFPGDYSNQGEPVSRAILFATSDAFIKWSHEEPEDYWANEAPDGSPVF